MNEQIDTVVPGRMDRTAAVYSTREDLAERVFHIVIADYATGTNMHVQLARAEALHLAQALLAACQTP